jgi:hypothetical protein
MSLHFSRNKLAKLVAVIRQYGWAIKCFAFYIFISVAYLTTLLVPQIIWRRMIL